MDRDPSIQENPAVHTIRVIKMYRERTGLNLREAKDAVEAWIKIL